MPTKLGDRMLLGMKYPLPDQYNKAVQNPELCFSDPELKTGVIELNKLGLPFVRCGNFSSVYKVILPDKEQAVKCFFNYYPDIKFRYERISECLHTRNSPYFIDFKYQENGIRVNGKNYPLLLMDWITGISFDKYIDECVKAGDTEKITALRDSFVSMCKQLQTDKIAHGDLQHANIIVTPNGLKLIDYDGMYVASVTLTQSNEVGHPNYQHPKRTRFNYGETMDNFSVMVIHNALTALISKPALWEKYYNGDNLIFSEKDFSNTNQSPLFRELFSTDVLKTQAALLAKTCLMPLDKSPDFLALLDADGSVSADLLPEEIHLQPETVSSVSTGNTPKTPADMVLCPKCTSAQNAMGMFCNTCGYSLINEKPPQLQTIQTAKPFKLPKFKTTALFFLVFSFVLFLYDNTKTGPVKNFTFDDILTVAEQFLSKGRVEKLTKSIEADPVNPASYYQRAMEFVKAGSYDKAIEDFTKVLKYEPQNAKAYLNRGVAFGMLGFQKEAVTDYIEAAKLGLKPAQDFLDSKNIKWKTDNSKEQEFLKN
ncbi:tetratricopeptide repeat protein [Candidatus Magnetomonas plexicatena]|uniref:tetratricopeptide repeat protein n=1 Tax=Candidatus Magnetomonas plexicatena TaxID=2552947 RepID=UPI001C77FD64|nr:tetratricopeptide repeat protein [Nitrospirales bacterium LBB_01]